MEEEEALDYIELRQKSAVSGASVTWKMLYATIINKPLLRINKYSHRHSLYVTLFAFILNSSNTRTSSYLYFAQFFLSFLLSLSLSLQFTFHLVHSINRKLFNCYIVDTFYMNHTTLAVWQRQRRVSEVETERKRKRGRGYICQSSSSQVNNLFIERKQATCVLIECTWEKVEARNRWSKSGRKQKNNQKNSSETSKLWNSV